MTTKLLMLPLILVGAMLMSCEDKGASQSPDVKAADARAADAKAAADKAADSKAAADAKANVNKDSADAKAAADKAAANAAATADKAAIDAKAAVASKAAADAKVAGDAVRDQATKLLTDLQTAVTGQKWSDAAPLVKQLDALRDRLADDQKASFDTLKKQYNDNKP